ncbi:mRNA cap methyltransferase [Grosmannia clavigera kw1407]|uniref:mRNA cap guanine-N(7) methyltransferase n=1 Tax=Grosmannia clavigera (strain kw1407 / UAMH 11150) TaxID=655863 RepID=F0XLJ7_GROCL|nr:mRNA cap methyltransferase [Grosmannia clavigera kw1407]EFX01246.1 mRNA cap methyltransferase [Grosmannia clavigera kw1407]
MTSRGRSDAAGGRAGGSGARPDDDYNRRANDDLPQPFDAKSLERAKKRARSRSPTGSGGDQARKPKRPGQRARITEAEREAIRQRALERERQALSEEQQPQQQQQRAHIDDVVRSHYNAVPERGREWRKTASTIRGLRSLNNWVKSCIIQKFSPDEDFDERGSSAGSAGSAGRSELLVLDIGCGKGGDLGKWNQAPQKVQLYVGLDPADVSIDQARDRYREMTQRGGRGGGRGGGYGGHHRAAARVFDGRFFVKDCFGESIVDIGIVRDVGFDANPLSTRGFDVVSMMFCMHYAFETEEKARTMLRNVSSALKKGGRFIGCIPDSDVIGERVRQFHAQQEKKPAAEADVEAAAVEKPADEREEGELDTKTDESPPPEPTAEWGNSIYRVRFPGPTPADGTFRPPFGWKYNFFLNEAVEEVPEYVVPWHAFRALAEDYNLELQYHKPFPDIWEAEKDDRILGPLSERMSVRDRGSGDLLVNPEEMEAASLYVGFCFYKV